MDLVDSIVLVSPRYPPYIGGVETHVSQMAKRARKFFDHVSVITTDPSWHLGHIQKTADGLTIHRIRSFAPSENYHFPSPIELFAQLKESRPQVLHIHALHDLPGPVAGFMDSQSSLIFTPHYVGRINSRLGRVLFKAYRPLVHKLIKKVPRIICTSRFEARLMAATFPDSSGKIELIPNGVDREFQEKYPWREPAEPRILYAGRLERYKNVDKILRAVAQLQPKHEDLKTTIVGRGPFKPELLKLAASLKVNGGVEWLEGLTRDELFELYSSATAVIVPSESESMGVAAAEAIGVGAPTIVADASGLAEFVEEGLAQPIEPPVTHVKLAQKIEEVLDDPKRFSPIGMKSPLIKTWDEVAEQTYRSCAS